MISNCPAKYDVRTNTSLFGIFLTYLSYERSKSDKKKRIAPEKVTALKEENATVVLIANTYKKSQVFLCLRI